MKEGLPRSSWPVGVPVRDFLNWVSCSGKSHPDVETFTISWAGLGTV